MARPLTDVIGARTLTGAYDPPPCDSRVYKQALGKLEGGGGLFTVRYAVSEDAMLAAESTIQRMTARLREEAARSGVVSVVMAQTRPEGRGKPMTDHVEPFDASGEPFRVGFGAAMRLLAVEPYCFLFEEVDNGQVAQPLAVRPGRPVPGGLADAQKLQLQLNAERSARQETEARLERLERLLASREDDDDTDAPDDGADTSTPRPPRPKRRKG